MLEKNIRRAIVEAKEKKETLLIEQQIIKSRIMIIVEDVNNIKNFKKLPKSKQEKLAFTLFREFAYLQNNLLITEDIGFLDILKKLFGNVFGKSAIETIAEPLVDKILTAIGFTSQGIVKKTVISLITTDPRKLIAAFQDCHQMTKLLLESFAEGLIMKMQDEAEKGSMIYDYIRNTLGGKISGSDFINDMEAKISGPICSLFDKFSGNAKDIVTKLQGGN
jgi:hypothetical protein